MAWGAGSWMMLCGGCDGLVGHLPSVWWVEYQHLKLSAGDATLRQPIRHQPP